MTVDDVTSNKLYRTYLDKQKKDKEEADLALNHDGLKLDPSQFGMSAIIDGTQTEQDMRNNITNEPKTELHALQKIEGAVRNRILNKPEVLTPNMMSESEKEDLRKKEEAAKNLPANAPEERTKTTVQDILDGNEKKKTASDSFLDALAYFAPTIVAGIGGAIIGGSEAGLSSASAATTLNKGWLDFQQKNKELDKQENDPYKRASLLLREREANIAEKSMLNRKDAAQNLDQYRVSREARMRQQFEADKPFKEIRAKTAQARVDLAKVKAAGFSDKQVSDISKASSAIDEVNSSINMIDANPKLKTEIGPFGQGAASNIKEMLGANSPEYTKLIAKVKYFKSDVYHEKFGTAISKQEMSLLKDVLPTEYDTLPKFKEKLANFEAELAERLKNNLNQIKTAQPLKSNTVDELNKNIGNKKPTRAEIEAELKKRRGN